MPDSAIDSATFRSVLGRFASGVTVVTIRDPQGADHGMTVSAFCSLSLDPPLVLVCVDRTASMYDAFARTDRFAVNVLQSTQEELARRFAEEHPDRFDGVGFTRGLTGAAIIEDTLATIECTVLARHSGGDHTIVLGSVIGAVTREGRPLLYYRGGYAMLER